jgi:hypothetical protein
MVPDTRMPGAYDDLWRARAGDGAKRAAFIFGGPWSFGIGGATVAIVVA